MTVDDPTVRGTGVPGATISLTGSLFGTVSVLPDGTWSSRLQYPVFAGGGGAQAVQTIGDVSSDSVSIGFSIVYSPAVVQFPIDGASYPKSAAPDKVSGVAIDSAVVFLSVDGVTQAAVARDRGAGWEIPLDAPLSTGTHDLVVTRGVDVTESDPVRLTVTVVDDTPAAGAGKASLAETGIDPAQSVFISLGLVILGIGVWMLVRGRRESTGVR
ncbi:hypothetical protein [Plantibacter sp. YIM 135249]|uniref:hypothetical protein n=1 Tax=Plantibacter sp. YIM 135249 TaxID=3423918 RepID=UPI003D349905